MFAYLERLGHTSNLEHGADASLHVPQMRIGSQHRNAARVGTRQTQQHSHQRGLAGAVGTEQRQQFAGVNLEIQVAQCDNLSVALLQVAALGHTGRPEGCGAAWHFG